MNLFWFLKRPTTYQSKINGMITIGLSQKNKALFSGGVTQSGGEITPMWNKTIDNLYACHPELVSGSQTLPAQKKKIPKQVRNDKKNILVLGVGGGSVIQSIRRHDRSANIIGVEIDPVMKQVAAEQFQIEETSKQKIIIADAIDYLMTQTKQHSFDIIVVDLYIGPLNPAKTRTRKYMQRLEKVLKPNGYILYNAHFQIANTNEYKNFRKITDSVFRNVEEVFSYPLNRVLLFSNHSKEVVK